MIDQFRENDANFNKMLNSTNEKEKRQLWMKQLGLIGKMARIIKNEREATK
jgi:hypothetical protein